MRATRNVVIDAYYCLDGRNAFGGADTTTKSFEQSQTQGSTTSSTAHGLGNQGPHNSNMMNKLDPRVDSDRGKFDAQSVACFEAQS
jgi:hypothetical protein